MLKDIIKIAHRNEILLSGNKFIFQNKEIDFASFISFVNKNKFTNGIEGAIKKSKDVLFKSNKDKIINVK